MQLRKRSKSSSCTLTKDHNQHIPMKKMQKSWSSCGGASSSSSFILRKKGTRKRKRVKSQSNIDHDNFGIKVEKDTRENVVGHVAIKIEESPLCHFNDAALFNETSLKIDQQIDIDSCQRSRRISCDENCMDNKKCGENLCESIEIESLGPTSDKVPSILEHLNLEQNTLAFLESLPPPPNVETPALPPAKGLPTKTLVLDLDETLVHCSLKCLGGSHHQVVFSLPEVGITTVYVQVRPYVKEFLKYAATLFELVVFTASNSIYANKIIDLIDPDKTLFKHRMFRHHCYLHKKMYVKDLRALGRDMSRVVILDNSVEAFGFQLDNGILCNTWVGCPRDTELKNLMYFLQTIHMADDVRDAVTHFYSVCDF